MEGVVTETFDISSLGLTDAPIQALPPHVEVTSDLIRELERDFYVIQSESFNELVGEDDDAEDWKTIEKSTDCDRLKLVNQARYLARKSPHVKRAIDLYLYYVLGDQFRPSVVPRIEDYDDLTEADEKKHKKIIKQADWVWKTFRRVNRRAWTPSEKLQRVVRDGEVLTRVLDKSPSDPSVSWVPLYRFLDPEEIDDGEGDSGTRGIVTDPNDVVEPLFYQRYDAELGKVVEEIPADQVFHWKICVDSNEKRGRTIFESAVVVVRQLMGLIHNEVTHRTAQSAIVLVRKVAGRNKARQLTDNAFTSQTQYPDGDMNREKYRAGTILTTNTNTELEFAQPSSNFSDASPLVQLLIGHLAAATGWTTSQLTTDPSGGSFASALVGESPVLQMLQYWYGQFSEQSDDEFRYVIDAALEAGVIEYDGDDFWSDYDTHFYFPTIANTDPLKAEQTYNLGLINRSVSRAEVQRQKGLDPDRMRYELQKESDADIADMAAQGGSNPDLANTRQSSKQNAQAGGTNQGNQGEPVKHRDDKNVKANPK